MNGTLALRRTYYVVRIQVGEQAQQTRTHDKGQESHVEQDITLSVVRPCQLIDGASLTVCTPGHSHVEGADGRESVIAEILGDQNQVFSRGVIGLLGDLIDGRKGAKVELDGGAAVVISSMWSQEPKQP
ncbi:hypothetical protein PINS_up020417 [Pythium insidiosum]|nr:hypothetical protein PINS_up020417 [Pythium insidiosum]